MSSHHLPKDSEELQPPKSCTLWEPDHDHANAAQREQEIAFHMLSNLVIRSGNQYECQATKIIV